jgi:phospholipid-translocating ATPase
MLDGIYQSVMVFYIPYLLFMPARPITMNGLSIDDRYRLGAYIAHPAVLTINSYILMNTYRWDWLMLLIVFLSDIFIFFWTGIYTSFTSSDQFYGAAKEVYGEATFWAVLVLVPVICLFPRFAIKSLQKVFFPYDVDIVREQERLGAFAHLKPEVTSVEAVSDEKSQKSKSSGSSRAKHNQYASVDEDLRPIYPPSTVTRTTTQNHHSQNGSDSTNYTNNRYSLEVPPTQTRPSMDRARPSYDRMRQSMDRTRYSYEASNDFTSAARLSRIESSRSHAASGLTARLRGLSLTKSANV